MTTVRGEMSKKKKKSLNTEEALILGNPPPPCLDDDGDDHLFNPSLSSSLSSTDRFDPIKNYPSISSLEIDSKNHSHQPMEEEEEEEEEERGGREEDRMEVKSSCSVVVKLRRSAIKEKRRSSVQKKKMRNKKDMRCTSLHSIESTESTSVVPKDEKRKSSFGTPQSKRLDCRDRGFELMPPLGSHKKSVPATSDVDQPIDPNEPTYCVCHQVSHGDMIACYMDNCQGGEWFHYSCVGLTPETRFKGNWYCPTCKLLPLL